MRQALKQAAISEERNADVSQTIGEDIRKLRKMRGMTLSDLSNVTGMSVSGLSQIERGISSPTIKALFEISRGLGVNIAWFFHTGEERDTGETRYIVRADNRLTINFKTGITDELLNTKSVQDLQVLMSSFDPGATSGDEPYSHNGEECGVVIQGELELYIDSHRYVLKTGDSFAFPSTLKHSYRNTGDVQALVVWATTPPTY